MINFLQYIYFLLLTFDTWVASNHYFFVLGSEFFLLLCPGLLTFGLSFVLGLFA